MTSETHTSLQNLFADGLRNIILASGDFFLLSTTVSDSLVEALRRHSEYLARTFHNRLSSSTESSTDSPICLTFSHLVSALSSCKLHLFRISVYLSTCAFAGSDPENTDSLQEFDGPRSKAIAAFETELAKHGITLDDISTKTPCPPVLSAGRLARMKRIDHLVTHKSSINRYIEFTRLRQRSRFIGRNFNYWLTKAGISLARPSTSSIDPIPILAYLVTLCLRDVIDVALVNRKRFGIDANSQMTAVELQTASAYIRKMKEYL